VTDFFIAVGDRLLYSGLWQTSDAGIIYLRIDELEYDLFEAQLLIEAQLLSEYYFIWLVYLFQQLISILII